MKRILLLMLSLLLLTGCATNVSTDVLSAEAAVEVLTEHLISAGYVGENLTGAAGEPLVWSKELVSQDDIYFIEGPAIAVEDIEIDGKNCYRMTLRYGEFDSAVAGRRYGEFAITRDGSTAYMLDIATSEWELLDNGKS